MNKSKLTVIIPAYMAAGTLERAILSAQNSGADEVIVVDDGSTDDTRMVTLRNDAQYIWQENAGAVVARKNGAERSKTEYLIFLDADDQLIPAGVAASIAHLEATPEDVVAAGRVIGVGKGNSKRIFPARYSPVNSESLLLQGYGPWPPCAAVIRAQGYRKSLGIPPQPLETQFAEDYEMLIRLSMVGGIHLSDTPACYYAMSGGKSEKSARLAVQCKEKIRAYYAEKLCIDIEPLTRTETLMAADIRQVRGAVASRRYIRAAVTLTRWFLRSPTTSVKKLASQPWTRN